MKKALIALSLGTGLLSAGLLATPALAEGDNVVQSVVETKNNVMVISTTEKGQVSIVKIDKLTNEMSICTPSGGCTKLKE